MPTAIEIISYNGVDPSIKQSEFDAGQVRARRYRNRRIGEFLKELKLTEGRGTGIPTIVNALKENGSPAPIFDINEPERTHFIVEIPIHPAFNGVAVSNVEERSTDQDADQDKNAPSDIVIEEINKLDQIVEEEKSYESDEDNDQDKSKFIIQSKSLLELISRIYEREKPDKKLITKYKESSFSLSNEQLKVLKFTNSPKSNKEIQEIALGLKPHTDNFKNHVEPLLKKGFIGRTIPNKPTSKLQKYFTTERGRAVIYIKEKLL